MRGGGAHRAGAFKRAARREERGMAESLPLCLGMHQFSLFQRYEKIHEIHTKDIRDTNIFLIFLFYIYVFLCKCRGLIIKSLYVRFGLEVT